MAEEAIELLARVVFLMLNCLWVTTLIMLSQRIRLHYIVCERRKRHWYELVW